MKEAMYTSKTIQKRAFLARQQGATNFISVANADLREAAFASNAFKQAGPSKLALNPALRQWR